MDPDMDPDEAPPLPLKAVPAYQSVTRGPLMRWWVCHEDRRWHVDATPVPEDVYTGACGVRSEDCLTARAIPPRTLPTDTSLGRGEPYTRVCPVCRDAVAQWLIERL